MKRIITSAMSGVCLSLLIFYAYGLATIEPAPIWEPPSYVCIYWIGGMPVWVCHNEERE